MNNHITWKQPHTMQQNIDKPNIGNVILIMQLKGKMGWLHCCFCIHCVLKIYYKWIHYKLIFKFMEQPMKFDVADNAVHSSCTYTFEKAKVINLLYYYASGQRRLEYFGVEMLSKNYSGSWWLHDDCDKLHLLTVSLRWWCFCRHSMPKMTPTLSGLKALIMTTFHQLHQLQTKTWVINAVFVE